LHDIETSFHCQPQMLQSTGVTVSLTVESHYERPNVSSVILKEHKQAKCAVRVDRLSDVCRCRYCCQQWDFRLLVSFRAQSRVVWLLIVRKEQFNTSLYESHWLFYSFLNINDFEKRKIVQRQEDRKYEPRTEWVRTIRSPSLDATQLKLPVCRKLICLTFLCISVRFLCLTGIQTSVHFAL
jgi:hypothetical protein